MRRVTLLFAILLGACATGADGSWVLEEFIADGETIPLTAEVTLDVDGRSVSGSSGCNTYSGDVGTDEGFIVFDNLAVTERFCVDTDVMALEARYLDVLVNERWRASTDGDRLGLVARGDDGPGLNLPTTLDYREAP